MKNLLPPFENSENSEVSENSESSEFLKGGSKFFILHSSFFIFNKL